MRLALVAARSRSSSSPQTPTRFTKQDAKVTMDDGVQLGTTLYLPDGPQPTAGWPGVIMLHGLGGNRLGMNILAETYFVSQGYAVLTYDVRGHGDSGGYVTIAGPARDRRPPRARGPVRGAARRRRPPHRRLGHLVRRRPDLARRRAGDPVRGDRALRDLDRPVHEPLPRRDTEVGDHRRPAERDPGREALAGLRLGAERGDPGHRPSPPRRALRRALGAAARSATCRRRR